MTVFVPIMSDNILKNQYPMMQFNLMARFAERLLSMEPATPES